MAYKQQKFISHSSGDWKCKIKLIVWSSSREDLLIGCRLLTSHCILMWWSAERKNKLSHDFMKSLIPIMRTYVIFSSVQLSRSVVSDSLRPHESQHARPPCPSPTPGVHPDSRPLSQWCHPAISSSVIPSPPAANPSKNQSLFQWVNSSHQVAKVLEFQL